MLAHALNVRAAELARVLRLSGVAQREDAPRAKTDQFGARRWPSCIVLRLILKSH
jgi:hypothetical protein